MSPTDPLDRLRGLLRGGDHLSATTTRNGKIVGFGESEGRGRTASGDADDSGTVTITLVGSSPRGEEGTIQACQRLILHLNAHGESWSEASEVAGTQHIDAIADSAGTNTGETLKIQVVRALTDPGFWKSLGHSGNATLTLSLSECTDILRKAIEFKAEKIPSDIREDLALVLDANDIPGLALDPVAQEFVARYASWARDQGFRGVWVVGPWKEMVNKLS